MAQQSDHEGPSAGRQLVDHVLRAGIDGVGPLKGAVALAEEHRRQHGDVEKAIDRLIATHTRLVAASGFASGVGGAFTMVVAVPADVAVLYSLAARCTAAVAHLRGYDVDSDEVRSVVLLSLLGSAGTGVLADAGIKLGNKTALAAVRRVPGRTLIEINKKVGFRLVTKFGQKGVLNLGKIVPVAGGGVGAAVNVATMRSIGRYAKSNFPRQPA